jgi:succinyl-diaminopimelate desuccinylase
MAMRMELAGDPVPLAQAMIRCASVTPADEGAQAVLGLALERLGFAVHHLRFGDIENLFARRGKGRPHFCFAGHTDVVPAGGTWRHGAFTAEIEDGVLYGRGACDMKGAIAAFVTAAQTIIENTEPAGSISLLITGDEEGQATDGTVRVLEWLAARGEIPDMCLVGEPTNAAGLGDMIKIGRRGSLNARIEVHGEQGHTAYPHRADNPVHRLVAALSELITTRLDEGSDAFEPSRLQLTSIDVGNPATNVIPASATACLNIRFNDHHTGAALRDWLDTALRRHASRFDLTADIIGEAFITAPSAFTETLRHVVREVTGRLPALDTGGGTSDARFIARYCPVAEFGLVGASMHKADECVAVDDLRQLAEIYAGVLRAVVA